ncbi:MAG: hypothetical protein H0X26_06285 [Alphaproteobacteria bacterium]|nr:hypothetical protein [Alphaproteobacteria bacterium]
MAAAKLAALAENFKEISLDCQQLTIIIPIMEELIFEGLVRGRQLGDNRVLIIFELLEMLVLKGQQLVDDLEKRLNTVEA